MNLPHFGVTRPVPVRLLMLTVLVGGIYAALTLQREFFPQIEPDTVRISLPYPGATPQEIEESMARKVEDAVADLDEVDEIQTTITEGFGSLMVKLKSEADVKEAHDDIERAVDALEDLPEDAEEIRVVDFEVKIPAIMLSLYGPADEAVRKRAIRDIADDLRSLPGMGDVVISGIRRDEIRVDVDQSALVRHQLSLPQISDAINAWMADLPGGAARTSVGNVNVRTLGVTEQAQTIRDIIIQATPNGQALRVGDIATVTESFADDQLLRRFNGEPAVSLTVFKTGDQDAIDMTQLVRGYVAGRAGQPLSLTAWERIAGSSRTAGWELGASHTESLPGTLVAHSDWARLIEGRLRLLTENGLQGTVLIFLCILLVLNFRTAFWVVSGLVTAICGTMLLMQIFDVSLNMLTMFGLLITLGMLEDDAIVVSENITAHFQRGVPPLTAAIKGATEVFWPVIGTVLTTVVAFLPLVFVKGRIGDLLGALPLVVLFSLIVSVIETMTLLPSHMAHAHEKALRGQPGRIASALGRWQAWRDRVVIARLIDRYAGFLRTSLRYHYLAATVALAILIVSLGMVAGGRLPFTFLPDSGAETIIVEVRLPVGAPLARTDSVVRRIETAARAHADVRTVAAVVGEQMNIDMGVSEGMATHVAQMFIELTLDEVRTSESAQVIEAIRESVGPLDEVESIRYSELGGAGVGPDITIRVAGDDNDAVNAAADDVKAVLARYDGVHDIVDDNFDAQRELQIQLKPGAAALGFTVADVARQVRGALYGLEPHVFSARREDIKVRVRLDEASRQDLSTIENLWITPMGGTGVSPVGTSSSGRALPFPLGGGMGEGQPGTAAGSTPRVPLGEIADITDGRSFAAIRRVDRRRTVTVNADVAAGVNTEEVMQDFAEKNHLATIQAAHSGASISFAGRQRDLMDAFTTLPTAFGAALLMIYVILAWLFSSFTQPLVVMIAIPFGIIGVIWGHLLLGYPLTFLSLIGFVALTGVVVNNSLILIEFYNTKRAAGMAMHEALVSAGRDRLRAIVLTSITTFFGLMPLVFEQEFQAKFLIPMAISISFGLLSATVLTLAVLPCLMVILDDAKRLAGFLWNGRWSDNEPATPANTGQEVLASTVES